MKMLWLASIAISSFLYIGYRSQMCWVSKDQREVPRQNSCKWLKITSHVSLVVVSFYSFKCTCINYILIGDCWEGTQIHNSRYRQEKISRPSWSQWWVFEEEVQTWGNTAGSCLPAELASGHDFGTPQFQIHCNIIHGLTINIHMLITSVSPPLQHFTTFPILLH